MVYPKNYFQIPKWIRASKIAENILDSANYFEEGSQEWLDALNDSFNIDFDIPETDQVNNKKDFFKILKASDHMDIHEIPLSIFLYAYFNRDEILEALETDYISEFLGDFSKITISSSMEKNIKFIEEVKKWRGKDTPIKSKHLRRYALREFPDIELSNYKIRQLELSLPIYNGKDLPGNILKKLHFLFDIENYTSLKQKNNIYKISKLCDQDPDKYLDLFQKLSYSNINLKMENITLDGPTFIYQIILVNGIQHFGTILQQRTEPEVEYNYKKMAENIRNNVEFNYGAYFVTPIKYLNNIITFETQSENESELNLKIYINEFNINHICSKLEEIQNIIIKLTKLAILNGDREQNDPNINKIDFNLIEGIDFSHYYDENDNEKNYLNVPFLIRIFT